MLKMVCGSAMKTSAQHYTEQVFTEAITLLVVATAGRCYSCSVCESQLQTFVSQLRLIYRLLSSASSIWLNNLVSLGLPALFKSTLSSQ